MSGLGRVLQRFALTLPDDATAALARLRAEGVPAAAVDDAVPASLAAEAAWRKAVDAADEHAARVVRATARVEDALRGVAGVALADPLLGPAWSRDVDVYVAPRALAPASAALAAAGAVPVDRLTAALRSRAHGEPPRHFAIVEAGQVLAAVELVTALATGGPPAGPAVQRAVAADGGVARLAPADVALRRFAKLAADRHVTVRGLAELTALLELGAPLPSSLARGVLRRHERLESELVGAGPVAAAAAGSPRRPGARVLWAQARARALRNRLSPARPARVRVAFCGIDGAGKSTQAALLADNLLRADVPAHVQWTRLGNKASGLVAGPAKLAQRLLPRGSHSFEAVRAEAGRKAPDRAPSVAPPLTRRGVIGWSWALAVTLDYLARFRAACRRSSGEVLVLDRALPDALVELEDNYGVALQLGLQRRLLERWTPLPQLAFYLELPGEKAKARKDDEFTAAELEIQRARYEGLLTTLPWVVRLDAQLPREELAEQILRRVAASAA